MQDQWKLFLIIAVVIVLVYTQSANAGTLSCTVRASACSGGETAIWRMSGTSNAHAELPSQSNYSQLVCCSGVTGLGTSCTGTFATALKLSGTTNAHVEQNSQANYANNACISVPSGGSVSVGYQATNCTGFDTTLGSMTGTTNAHVGDGTAYTTKICATAAGAAASLTFTVDTGSVSFVSAITPGTPVSTSSVLTVNTDNATGYNIKINRASTTPTLILSADNSTTIPDTPNSNNWTAPAATSTAGPSAVWTVGTTKGLGFRLKLIGTVANIYSSIWWGTDDAGANAKYSGISTSTAAQVIADTTLGSASNEKTVVEYKLDTATTQRTGTYVSSPVVFTATVNP